MAHHFQVVGYGEIDGIPCVNGKPARRDPATPGKEGIQLLNGTLSEWRCPECDARLSEPDRFCLNLCHLSAPSQRRFQAMMVDAMARVERRKRRQAMIDKGQLIEAIGDLERELDDDA